MNKKDKLEKFSKKALKEMSDFFTIFERIKQISNKRKRLLKLLDELEITMIPTNAILLKNEILTLFGDYPLDASNLKIMEDD